MTWLIRRHEAHTTLFNARDGSRVSFGPVPERLPAPELLDVKLTDVCSVGCAYCYQDSRPDRGHARLEDVALMAAEAGKAGVFEVALGGGEVSEYPHFHEVLNLFRDAGVVPNFTTRRMRWLSRHWLEFRELVGGVAVSVNSATEVHLLNRLIPFTERREGQLVVQVVMGTVERAELLKLVQEAGAAGIRVTLLGFKDVGRGQQFKPLDYRWWLDDLHEYVKHAQISIDTALASETPETLAELLLPGSYHTEEGRFSAYVDAVNMTLAPSSYHAGPVHLPLLPRALRHSLAPSSYHAGPVHPFNTNWLDAFASADFVQGPRTPHLEAMSHTISRVRMGFATNSSSSHSIVILKEEVPEDIPGNGYFGSSFTLITREAKQMYLAGLLMRRLCNDAGIDESKLSDLLVNKPEWWQEELGNWWPDEVTELPHRTDVGGTATHESPLTSLEDLKARWEQIWWRIQQLCDLQDFIEIRHLQVDHQSKPYLPNAPDGSWPDLDAWQKVAATLLQEDVAILGGWDFEPTELYKQGKADFVEWVNKVGLSYDEFLEQNKRHLGR